MPKSRFAPRRNSGKLDVIDWGKQAQEQAQANAEIVAVEERARQRRLEEQEARDPISQLVRRSASIEATGRENRSRIEELEREVECLRELVKASRTSGETSDRPKGVVRRFGRRA